MADFPGPSTLHTAHLYMQTVASPSLITHTIETGVSMLNAAIASVVSLFVGFGLGWYVKGRGATGVKTDIGNAVNTVKTDVSAL